MGDRLAALILCAAVSTAQAQPSRLQDDKTETEREVVSGVELRLPPGSDPSGFAGLVDVRLGQSVSIRGVRRSLERLFATGRLADVVVHAEPGERGTKIIFELTPRRQIGDIDVEGNHVLSRTAVRFASGLLSGGEFYPERIAEAERAVLLAYERRGYFNAKIRSQTLASANAVDVLFSIEEGSPTRVSGLSIAGHPGLRLWQVEDVIGLELGAILDRERLDRGIERLKQRLRDERFYRAQVGELAVTRRGELAAVVLPIDAGPRYTIHFHGNRSFRDRVLRAVLRYDGSESLDRGLIGRMVRRIASFYRYRGFYGVRIVPRDTWSPDQADAVLAFNIEEGVPLAIREVIFEGNRDVPSPELRAVLAQSIQANAPVPPGDIHPTDDPLDLEGRTATAQRTVEPDPDPSTVFVDDAYLEAAKLMTQMYHQRGFLGAQVSLASIEVDVPRESGVVRFEIAEGVQTVVREISSVGLPAGVGLLTDAGLAVGKGLSSAAIEQSRTATAQALARKGYLFARVTDSVTLSEDGKEARVVFQVDRGPAVHIGKIIVQGLARTHEEVVRANLQIRSGALLDPENLFDTQRSLALLGIFRTVGVKLIDPDVVEPVKDVVVELKERSRLDGNLFAGYSLVEGPAVGVDALYPNLFGSGANLSGRFKLNYILASGCAFTGSFCVVPSGSPDVQGLNGFGGRLNVSVHQPRLYSLLPAQVGWRLDLIGERVFRPSYLFTRYAGIAGLEWTVFKWLTASLQYELEHDRVRPESGGVVSILTQADQERLRFPFGIFTLHSLRPGMAIDFRDDPLNPHSGLLLSGYAEVSHHLSVHPSDTPPFPIFNLKAAGTATFYVPLASRVVLAISGRAGKVFHLQSDSQSIAPKRFFLGGTSSIRGFREDGLLPQDDREQLHREVANCRGLINPAGCTDRALALIQGQELPSKGGELFTTAKTEVRFPVFGSWDLGVFFETGNLWGQPDNFRPLELRYCAGAGVRYLFPIGPAALDVGFNLDPDRVVNESTFQVHFSVGLF